MIERVEHAGGLLAIILRAGFAEPGIHFFTPPEFSQQLGHMRHPTGHRIAAHVHNRVEREIRYTLEVLLIRRGVLRVDLFSTAGAYVDSRVLRAGDVILLASGGHGFEVLEAVDMVEVKQGPHVGAADKTLLPDQEPQR